MRAQIGLRIAGGLCGQRRIEHRSGGRAPHLHRHREPADPGVGAALEPFVVAHVCMPGPAPACAPAVLDPEPARVVTDDGERVVAADRLLAPGDEAAGRWLQPALVHRGRGVQHAGLGDRHVHRDEVAVVDPRIRTERMALRIARAALGVGVGLEGIAPRPHRLGGEAMAVPALHRATAAGAGVVLAFPFVVAARHVVGHARAEPGGHRPRPAAAQQGVGDGDQRERGAGTLAALVEHRHPAFQMAVERHRRRHVDQRGFEHAVAEIGGVGAGIEQALGLACGACGHCGSLRATGAVKRANRKQATRWAAAPGQAIAPGTEHARAASRGPRRVPPIGAAHCRHAAAPTIGP